MNTVAFKFNFQTAWVFTSTLGMGERRRKSEDRQAVGITARYSLWARPGSGVLYLLTFYWLNTAVWLEELGDILKLWAQE